MLDTITTRAKRRARRVISSFMCLVMAFMCLPLNAFAAPGGDAVTAAPGSNGAVGAWYPSEEAAGAQLGTYDTLYNVFESQHSKVRRILDDSIVEGAFDYKGLASNSPSTLWVMETLAKYCLLMDWATTNVVATEDLTTMYNLFYNNTSGGNQVETTNQWPTLKGELGSIIDAMNGAVTNGKFASSYPTWGSSEFSNRIGGVASSINSLSSLTANDYIKPGGASGFSAAAQEIWRSYYLPQMTYLLASSVYKEDVTSLSAISSPDACYALLDTITEKLKGSKSDGVGNPGETGGSTTGGTVNMPTSIVPSTDLFIGDATLKNMALGNNWIELNDGVVKSDPSAARPGFNISNGDIGPTTLALAPDLATYFSSGIEYFTGDITTAYVMFGATPIYAFAEDGLSGWTADDYNDWADNITNVDGILLRLVQAGGKKDASGNLLPVSVRFCAIPASTDSAARSEVIKKINEGIKANVNELNTNTTYTDCGIHFDYIDISDTSLDDGASLYNTLASKVSSTGAITGIDTSGSQVTLPNEEGKSGLYTADLITAYKNCPDLQEYFDSLKSIETFANTLFNNHFQNETAEVEKEMKGYYQHNPNFITGTIFPFQDSALLGDIYEKAYTPNLVSTGTSSGPSEGEGDPNKEAENADSALQLISNCNFGEDYMITCDDGDGNEQLSTIGYTALAAGVVYDPFISMEGNDSYMAVIKDSLQNSKASDDSLAKIERFLHQAIQRKKPVYVLDGKYDQWNSKEDVEEAPTGNYRYAYVVDLLQGDNDTTRCYTVMKGGMAPSTVDTDTWVYSQGAPRTGGGDRVSDGVTYKTDSAANADSAFTPAGSKTMATANEMAAPIMFTCGTKEGRFSGNATGSAEGYAASLGGLTTVILHNAAQDAKDNQYVRDAESYMLFMNGLGDIVLADGTIILPAIANPSLYNYDNIQYSVEGSNFWEAVTGGSVAAAAVIGITAALSGGVSIPVVLGLLGTKLGAAGAVTGAVAGVAAGAGLSDAVHSGEMFWTESENKDVIDSYNNNYAYYPYSAAFMNHYPAASVNAEKRLAITNQNDKGKYVIGIDAHGDVLARKITGFNNKTQANLQYSGGGVTVAIPQALAFNVENDVTKIGTLLPYLGGEDGTFGSRFNTAVKFDFFMCRNGAYNQDDQSFFPLEDSNEAILLDDYLNRAGPLVTSAKRYLMERHPTGESANAHECFNVAHYIKDMAGQGLMGTMYGETLQKNYQISYDELVADTGNRLLIFFSQLVESAVDTLGNIDGVLAIKNGYENKFFNLLVSFIQEFYGLIAVLLMIIVAVKFLKGHYNMIFVLFIAAMCFCGFEVYANWMPTMVPNAYNFAVNDAVEPIVWNTVAVSAESYAETYQDSTRKDPTTGEPKPYTATMTLYKMTRQDMQDMASRLGTTYTDLKKGEIHYLDESAGIFVQGDAIKISLDRLLVNNSMRGLHQSQWQQLSPEFASSDGFITPVTKDSDMIANPYSVQITNPYVSLEAYYMPFNEIERAFLIQLNKFASVFRMEHNVFNYSRNLYKDAFLFNNYTNSGIFTAPGNKEVLEENIRIGSIVSRYATPEAATKDFLFRVYGNSEDKSGALFPVPEDWLGVAAVFRAPSENFKDSLWGKAMQRHEWYDENWNIIDPDALNDLIYYMNTQTKQFVIANSDQLNFCSDENAIKIVSLYATTTFTHYVSRFGSWLYPNYVNAADISLKDALYGSMTTLKDRNFSYDGTVVNTVAANLGVFGVIFILLITILSCLFVFVMTYLVPILYAMFGAIIIFKLINNSNGVGLVKGYVKVTGVTCFLYFVFSLSMRLVKVGGYAWYGYLGCALLMFLCCYFLFWVVLSVIQNAGEMGNDVLGQNLLRGLDHITHGAVRKLSANNLTAQRMNRGYGGRNYLPFGAGTYQYGRNYGVDTRDYIRGDRSRYTTSGRYEEVYDDYGRDSPFEESSRGFRGFRRVVTRYSERKTSKRFK